MALLSNQLLNSLRLSKLSVFLSKRVDLIVTVVEQSTELADVLTISLTKDWLFFFFVRYAQDGIT